MKTLLVDISEGYMSLIKTFCEANELDIELGSVKTDKFSNPSIPKITLSYDETTDTASALAFLAIRHSGIDNMLSDYLMRCGINPDAITIGKTPTRSATDADYEEYKKLKRAEKGWTGILN